MRLNPIHVSHMTPDQMRLLQCMEMLSKNHEYMPMELLASLYKRPVYNELRQLMQWKLISYENNHKTCGYRLGYGGYDYMALYTLMKRGLQGIGKQLGVGKESDVYLGRMTIDDKDMDVVIKIHRLGRTSFRTVKQNRDYLEHRHHASWLLMSRLSAQKEYGFMEVLYGYIPMPRPIAHNRHCVVMTPIEGYPMTQILKFQDAQAVYDQMWALVVKLASLGLIHGDLNVFNLLVTESEEVFLIDFPQMVSIDHADAVMYYERDCRGVQSFGDKFGCETKSFPQLDTIERTASLDVLSKASGYIKPKADKTRKEQRDDISVTVRTELTYTATPKKKVVYRKGNKNKHNNKVKKTDYVDLY